MKRISAKGNFDKEYLFACLALAGYNASASGVREILYPLGLRTVQNKLQDGDFNRVQMIKIAKACEMDSYDFLRVFFTDLLREDRVRNIALKEMLWQIMIDETLDL